MKSPHLPICNKQLTELLLIDGYNLIKADPLLVRRERFGLQAARLALEQRLRAYVRRTGAQVIVFFDGDEGFVAQPAAPQRQEAFQVLFSHPPQKADELLKQAIQQRHGARRVRLITADRDIRRYARQHRIRSTSSSQFIDELAAPADEQTRKIRPSPPPELDPELTLDIHEIDLWERFFQQQRNEE